jgi:hypothetical protein
VHAASGPSTCPLPVHLVGLKVVHEPHTESSNGNTVSIVFGHGLGGSPRETWTHPSLKISWPTLLHEDDRFGNARISIFGYNANFANIFALINILGITDFANQLLDVCNGRRQKGSGFGRSGPGVVKARERITKTKTKTKTKLQAKELRRKNYGYKY